MHPSTPPADRAIYEASARLEKSLSQLAALRESFPKRALPNPAAEAHMEDTEDHIDLLFRGLSAALVLSQPETAPLQEAEKSNTPARTV